MSDADEIARSVRALHDDLRTAVRESEERIMHRVDTMDQRINGRMVRLENNDGDFRERMARAEGALQSLAPAIDAKQPAGPDTTGKTPWDRRLIGLLVGLAALAPLVAAIGGVLR